MSDLSHTPNAPQKTVSKKGELKEVKYSLTELLEEVADERSASSMAKQIVDQTEIQKMMEDSFKAKKRKQKASSSSMKQEPFSLINEQKNIAPPVTEPTSAVQAAPSEAPKEEQLPQEPSAKSEDVSDTTPSHSTAEGSTSSDTTEHGHKNTDFRDLSSHRNVKKQLIGNFLSDPDKRGLAPPQKKPLE